MSSRNFSDEELVNLYESGDNSFFDSLYRRHGSNLKKFFLRRGHGQECDDLVQDTWLRVYMNFDKFDPDKGSFSNWLYGIARNSYIDLLRKKVLTSASDEDDWPLDLEDRNQTSPLDGMIFDELVSVVADASSPIYRSVGNAFLRGTPSRIAAEVLGISEECFRKRLQRWRGDLAQAIENTYNRRN